ARVLRCSRADRSRSDFGRLYQTMGRGIAGWCYWFTFSDCTTEAVARQTTKHRFRQPGRACLRRISSIAMVRASRLAEHAGKTWSEVTGHGQRAALAYTSINAPIISRPKLGLLFACGRLEFGRAQESLEFHRSAHCWLVRWYHRRQF